MANKLIESKGGNPSPVEIDTRTKLAQDVKAAWQSAFRALQKSKKFSLLEWAKRNPTEFYRLSHKFVPQDVNLTGNITLQVITGVPGLIDAEGAIDIPTEGVGHAHDAGLANGIKADFIDDGSDLA